MRLFISVVNHNHDAIICDNETLKSLAKEHSVILKSNTIATKQLKQYCNDAGITLLQGRVSKGFAENNNEVFSYIKERFSASGGDHFLVLNPDVTIDNCTLNSFLSRAEADSSKISTINLYANKEMTKYDNSIRRFPSLLNPVKTLLGIKRSDYYDKSNITSPCNVDWAAGSFLLFKYNTYENLNGFDEKYYMYFEDADICRRAYKKGINVTYYPNYKAIHKAQFKNRIFFSRTFIYYLFSNLIYFFGSSRISGNLKQKR